MSKMEIFDPAMCCSTGICGPSVNPELIRVAAVIENLKKMGIIVTRHNLSSEPQAYTKNSEVQQELNRNGVKVLPITFVDGKVVKKGGYLSNQEFADFFGVKVESIQSLPTKVKVTKCKCGPKGCC